jgi:hypothetical protein
MELETLEKQFLNQRFQVRELNFKDFENYDLSLTKNALEQIQKRFKHKYYKVFGVFENDRLVYYAWISLNHLILPKTENHIKLKENEGFLFNAFCHEDYRGYGIHTFMNYYRLSELKKSGKSIGLVAVLRENIPARKSQHKVGMQSNSFIRIVDLFGKKRTKRVQKKTKLI